MVPDMTLIQGAVMSLKAAGDIAKGLLHLQSLAEVQTKVIELQSAILAAQSGALAAQSQQSTMIQRVRDLEEEIAHVKAWEEQKQRYQLIEPWNGCFVYALKELCKGTEIPHWICEHCYQDGRKSIIQNGEKWDSHTIQLIKCSHCLFWNEISGDDKRQYV